MSLVSGPLIMTLAVLLIVALASWRIGWGTPGAIVAAVVLALLVVTTPPGQGLLDAANSLASTIKGA